jgi:FSR family fosmidomycin resistance protein-like MFS transporter
MADTLPAVLSAPVASSTESTAVAVDDEGTNPAESLQEPAAMLKETASPLLAISLLAAMHFLVDTAAGTVNPLWQGFEEKLGVGSGGLLWVVFCWQAATSFSQLLFAWWADRAPKRWLIWAGPCVGATCMGLTGLAPNPAVLVALLVVAGLGIAAFHPEGAAAAGAIAPLRRSRMMAIFALWGYLGQSLGPFISAKITTAFGFPALAWGGLCGLTALLLLMTQRRYIPTPPLRRAVERQSSTRSSDWRDWGLLLSVGTLRIVPSIGVPLVIAYWLIDREIIGATQSAFMIGVGAGSILCAFCVRPQWERGLIWGQPLLAAPCLIAVPLVPQPWLATTVGLCGFMLGIALPVFISYGQQMLPHHPRAASSITLGVSWGTAGGLVVVVMWAAHRWQAQPQAFFALAAFSIAAGLLSMRLPRVGECEK